MKKSRLALFLAFLAVGILCIASLSYAAVPRVINYQGKFTDKDNNPLSGNYIVTFRLYEVASGGEFLWEEGHILNIEKGLFNALLGSIKPLEIDFDKDLWLGIEVASDGEMSPRIKLASSAYAFNAQTIDMLESTQLLRSDIDAVMSGSLTLKKDLVLKGSTQGPSRIVLTDAKGREYYLWMDNSGGLRLKQGLPSSDKDGTVVIGGSSATGGNFIQTLTLLLLIVAVFILGLMFYSTKKK